MKRCLVLAVGRLKDRHTQKTCADYYRRCSRRLTVEQREVKDLAALTKALPDRGVMVALDERGKGVTSRELAEMLRGWTEGPQPGITFIIGGADGLDVALRARADHLLSLSKMTFAHRLVRLILAEQLYRAVSIIEGSPYHRD